MNMRFPVMRETERDEDGGKWTEWINPLPGYKLACCDCSLVHDMEFAIVNDDVIFRARRNERLTKQMRYKERRGVKGKRKK